MAVLKVIEVLANSEKSWEDATKNAVKQASKSVKNIKAAAPEQLVEVVGHSKAELLTAYFSSIK